MHTLNRAEKGRLILAALWIGMTLVACGIIGQSQTPLGVDVIRLDPTKPDPDSSICLYHPETLMRSDPAGRLVFIHHTTYGWPQAWPAIEFIRSEWPSGNPDRQAQAVVAAVQYSIYLSPGKIADAQRVALADYLPHLDRSTIPALSLHEAVRQFLWSGNLQTRSSMRYWLRQVVESRTNADCNPWHPYKK